MFTTGCGSPYGDSISGADALWRSHRRTATASKVDLYKAPRGFEPLNKGINSTPHLPLCHDTCMIYLNPYFSSLAARRGGEHGYIKHKQYD